MASKELCIQFASTGTNRRRWKSADKAKKAAMAILQDCLDRRGIKHEFGNCDPDVVRDILESWAEIIRAIPE